MSISVQSKQRAAASLTIASAALRPGEITRLLKIEPSETHEAGERMSRRNPRSALYSQHLWILRSNLPERASLADHVSAILEKIEQSADTLSTVAAWCEEELFLGLFADDEGGAFTLEHIVWQRIAQLPFAVVLDLYPPYTNPDMVFVTTEQVHGGSQVPAPRKWAAGLLKVISVVFGPEDITRVLDLTPTSVHAGTARSSDGMVHGPNREPSIWQAVSGVSPTASLESHVDALLRVIEERGSVLDTLAADADLHVSLGFAAENGQGGAWFERNLVERIARLPIDLTIHLYPTGKDVARALLGEEDAQPLL